MGKTWVKILELIIIFKLFFKDIFFPDVEFHRLKTTVKDYPTDKIVRLCYRRRPLYHIIYCKKVF